MLLSDSEILKQIENNNIVITPFDPKNLGSNSYDLCLGENLKVYKKTVVKRGNKYLADTYSTHHFLDFKKEEETIDIKIPEQGLILNPGILYLGVTKEYTESHKVVPFIEGKSSVARLGLKVHFTAGRGDEGFCGHWTLEIEVIHRVKVYPGMKIAQIIFFETGFVINSYNKNKDSKYVNKSDQPMASQYYKNFHRERFIDSGVAGIDDSEE